MTSNVFDERQNYIYQLLEQTRKNLGMTEHELTIHLLALQKAIVEENIKKSMAIPRYAYETLLMHKKIKEEANMLVYKIDSKKNVLKSLSKEYMKKYNGK